MSPPNAVGSKQTKARRVTGFQTQLFRLLVSQLVPGLVTGMGRAIARALVPCVGGFGPLPITNPPNLSRLLSMIFSESISQCPSPPLHSENLGLTCVCWGATSALSGSPTPTVAESLATHRGAESIASACAAFSRHDQQMPLTVAGQLVPCAPSGGWEMKLGRESEFADAEPSIFTDSGAGFPDTARYEWAREHLDYRPCFLFRNMWQK